MSIVNEIIVWSKMLILFAIGLLFGDNLEIDFPCESELPTDSVNDMESIPNYTLLQTIVLTRHGARSPIDTFHPQDTGKWYCDDESNYSFAPRYAAEGGKVFRRNHLKLDENLTPFPPSCPDGGLLTSGMKQHNELGKAFRKHYVDNLGFLPKKYSPRYIWVRSSEVDRCIRSAQSFISGLYPPRKHSDIVTIETGTPSLELLHPSTSQCSDLGKAWKQWVSSPEYLSKKNFSEPYLRPLADEAKVTWNEPTWMFIGDWIATVACTNHSFPKLVNDTVIQIGMEAVEFYSHGFFSFARGIAGSSILREILRIIDDRIAGRSEIKFALLSAHDVSIVAVLILLGFDNPHWSPFRSYFITELWRDPNGQLFLRFLYNSKLVNVDFMDNNSLFKLSHFKNRASKYLGFCREFP